MEFFYYGSPRKLKILVRDNYYCCCSALIRNRKSDSRRENTTTVCNRRKQHNGSCFPIYVYVVLYCSFTCDARRSARRVEINGVLVVRRSAPTPTRNTAIHTTPANTNFPLLHTHVHTHTHIQLIRNIKPRIKLQSITIRTIL